MAIRNTNFTGATTNWTSGELGLSSTDLNDTFTAAFNKIQSISSYWLNSDLISTYDDFTNYSVGSLTTNSSWTVTNTVTGSGGNLSTSSITIATSTNAGGTGKEAVMVSYADSGGSGAVTSATTTLLSKLLTANKHKYLKLRFDYDRGNAADSSYFTGYIDFYFGSSYYRMSSNTMASLPTFASIITGGDGQGNINIFVVAKGSNVYDIYINGYKRFSSITEATPQIKLETNCTAVGTASRHASTTLYVASVIESARSI